MFSLVIPITNDNVCGRTVIPEKSGTSIIACEFEGGVIIGTDSQIITGNYINNRSADKLIKIDDYVYCSGTGSVAEIQSVIDNAVFQLQVLKMTLNEGKVLVLTVATVFQKLCYDNQNRFDAEIVIVGFDNICGGQVYVITSGGMMKREPVSARGTGSPYVYGYIDAHFKVNMSKICAEEFVSKTLVLATTQNFSSGSQIQIVVITNNEVKRLIHK